MQTKNVQVSPTKKPSKERVAISGIGFVSPLGQTAWDSIIAIHSKKINIIPHKAVLVNANENGTELKGATVCRVDELNQWLDDTECALALMKPALKECTAGVPKDILKTLVCEIDNLLTPDDQDFHASLKSEFSDIPIRILTKEDKSAIETPRCIFFERIIRSAEQLQNNQIGMALVGCVDSNVSYKRLNQLNEADKLSSATNLEGIIAGEAAGAVLLETESHARQRNAPIYAFISSWGRAVETKKWTVKSPSIGHGLSDAFFEAFSDLEDEGKSISRIVMDVNGELHRAYEWAINESRVFLKSGCEPYLAIPVFYTGDCGGAAGAAVMMEAIGCLVLDKKAPDRIALGTADDAGARRTICIEKEQPPEETRKTFSKVSPDIQKEVIARNEFFKTLREKYNQ